MICIFFNDILENFKRNFNVKIWHFADGKLVGLLIQKKKKIGWAENEMKNNWLICKKKKKVRVVSIYEQSLWCSTQKEV